MLSKETENNLLSEMEPLVNNLRSDNYDSYLEKKSHLQTIREDAIKGHQIRSREQWLNDRENSPNSSVLLSNVIIMRKLKKKLNCAMVPLSTDQKEILAEF